MVSTAEEALDRAAVARPHLAIVDLLLPDQHGIELCRRLREWSEMPILILSAVGDEQTKIDALQHGADDYVTKPFGPGELVARVKAALRRAGRDETEPRVEAGGVIVDLAAHAVWVDGRGGPSDAHRVLTAAGARAQPRPADDPPAAADRGLGAGVRGRHGRCCERTSPTCAASCRPVTRSGA